jgi:hypothetical protein
MLKIQNRLTLRKAAQVFTKSVFVVGFLGALISLQAQTVGYYASSSTPPGSAGGTLNIGQTFTVANTNIQVSSLGVFDFQGAPLNSSHTVILFSNQTKIASVTVPAGSSAQLINGFRFSPLPSPITLAPGTYSVVAYQLGSGDGQDHYGDPNAGFQHPTTGFNGTFNIQHVQTIYEFGFKTNGFPAGGTAGLNLASASLIFIDPNPLIIAYTADPIMTSRGAGANGSANGLNMGHTFTVNEGGITVYQVGVFNLGGAGLNASHTVTIFDNNHNVVTSAIVPSGAAATQANGFRFIPLSSPTNLSAGIYSIITYQMNASEPANDAYGEDNVSGVGISQDFCDNVFSPYAFTAAASPAYPGDGAYLNFACVSFAYIPNDSTPSPLPAYTAVPSGPYGGAANNGGLNIGHTFDVNFTNIVVTGLGAYNYGGQGLNASHDVTLFDGNHNVIASITVPAGTNVPLMSGYRYQALTNPIILTPGNYTVVAYQMNGNNNGSDGYGENYGSGFYGGLNVTKGSGTYSFTSNGSPDYPNTVVSDNFGSASILFAPYTQPVISTISKQSQNIVLNLQTSIGLSSRILATTNLDTLADWQPIFTNSAGGSWTFTDTNAAETAIRFYKVSNP